MVIAAELQCKSLVNLALTVRSIAVKDVKFCIRAFVHLNLAIVKGNGRVGLSSRVIPDYV